MPLLMNGLYSRSPEDYPYEVETTYQLKYYIRSALISIDCILEPDEAMIVRFENKVQYYRYYLDSLFYFLGLINDRFVFKSICGDAGLREIKQERAESNKQNYGFSEQDFHILCNKMPRNIIEHLDERNIKSMMQTSGAGGFNVIFEDGDPNMAIAIQSHREYYPYNLDLINKKVLFYNIQAKLEDVKEFDIDILELQAELKKLQQNVNDFARFLRGRQHE